MKNKNLFQRIGAAITNKSSQPFGRRLGQIFFNRSGQIQTYNDNRGLYIQKGYEDNPVVKSITRRIAIHGGNIPWVIKSRSTGEIVKAPLLQALMDSPNTNMCWGDFMQDLITQYVLTGNGFASFERGTNLNEGKPRGLFILPSEQTQIYLTNDLKAIQDYRVDTAASTDTAITASDVLHVKTPNPNYNNPEEYWYGQSPFKAARLSIQTYNKSMEAGYWFLDNKGMQKMIINRGEDELSPEGRDSLMQSIRGTGKGVENNGNSPFVDGDLDVIDLSVSAEEALVLEQRDQAAKEICMTINFPVKLLDVDNATYQNGKEAKKALWESVIIPVLTEMKHGINRWLVPHFGQDLMLDFDLSGVDALQEDKLLRFKAIKESAGMITINEARIAAGIKPFTFWSEPTNEEEFNEQVYVGFTQAVIEEEDDEGQEDKEIENGGA